MRILFLEPFFGGSHRDFAEGLAANSGCRVDLLTLPPRFWKWRMRGAALHFVRKIADLSVYDGLLPAGVVLCGGSARLAGMRELAREVMQLPVRIGAPKDLRGLVDTISNPAYAASVGLLLWGLRHGPPPPKPKRGGFLGRLLEWLRVFLPG